MRPRLLRQPFVQCFQSLESRRPDSRSCWSQPVENSRGGIARRFPVAVLLFPAFADSPRAGPRDMYDVVRECHGFVFTPRGRYATAKQKKRGPISVNVEAPLSPTWRPTTERVLTALAKRAGVMIRSPYRDSRRRQVLAGNQKATTQSATTEQPVN